MALWRASEPLVLASQSVARRAVLEAAGIPIEVRPAGIDERAVEAQAGPQGPGEVAMLLACEKARVVAAVMPGRLVLGADQTLALGDRRFSKPKDRAGAREQLRDLAGRTHALHSGFALVRDGEVLVCQVEVARLTMRVFESGFIDPYLEAAGDAALRTVGAYELEGIGVHLFERIEGDHFTILGLPLIPLLATLRHLDCVP